MTQRINTTGKVVCRRCAEMVRVGDPHRCYNPMLPRLMDTRLCDDEGLPGPRILDKEQSTNWRAVAKGNDEDESED